MRRWRLNSGYCGNTDQRRTAAGTIPSLKHYMERDLGEFNSTLWTPQEISTVFWLDAAQSSTLTISTGVSTWADRKGGGVNAVQATSANQPAYSATAFPGSLPGVLFDGSNDAMDISTTAMQNQTHGVYWVWSRSGAGTGSDAYRPSIGVLASAGQGTDRGALHYVKNSNNLGACYPYFGGAASVNYDLSSGTAYSNNVGNIMAFQSNITGWGVWRNGTLESTTNAIATPDNTNVGYSLARQYTVNRASNIVIAEVIMVQSTDTTTRQLIEGYFAWKWGLQGSLPVGHPYLNSAPTA
jgi:hypothetical protein